MVNKVKKKNKIDAFDSRLFGSLFKAKRPLPIKKLARRTDMSWQTANTHIKKLQGLKVVGITKTAKRTNVFIDPIFLKKIQKKRR